MQETDKVVPCEVWSRIVGYYRPVQNWNIGKRQEFKERKIIKQEKEEVHGMEKENV